MSLPGYGHMTKARDFKCTKKFHIVGGGKKQYKNFGYSYRPVIGAILIVLSILCKCDTTP